MICHSLKLILVKHIALKFRQIFDEFSISDALELTAGSVKNPFPTELTVSSTMFSCSVCQCTARWFSFVGPGLGKGRVGFAG